MMSTWACRADAPGSVRLRVGCQNTSRMGSPAVAQSRLSSAAAHLGRPAQIPAPHRAWRSSDARLQRAGPWQR